MNAINLLHCLIHGFQLIYCALVLFSLRRSFRVFFQLQFHSFNSVVFACTGKASKFTVTTLNAGAGTLAVHVNGPSKVALVCTEVPEGYEFTYTPMAPGNYMIMIKYSNVTIAGAPFKTVVKGRFLYCFIHQSIHPLTHPIVHFYMQNRRLDLTCMLVL